MIPTPPEPATDSAATTVQQPRQSRPATASPAYAAKLDRRAFTRRLVRVAAGAPLLVLPRRRGLADGEPTVRILPPRNRVPVSFVIDDSTCLVNMGHFCMPQFAEAWPQRSIYRKPWKSWPREIPDAFVREFAEWCGEHGVKGKYSVVPYPACVGWLDRELPGWSRRELRASLKFVRDVMTPNWDIHPEMLTHTRVIDLETGRPLEPVGSATMENSYPQTKKSVDELAAYIAYALQILKNCELPCEGITTPGGFGNLQKSDLALAVRHAVTDVFAAEIPHYFKYVIGRGFDTWPKIEHLDMSGDRPRLVVNVPAGTGDWFGNWDGDATPEPDRYATADASAGRMVELLEHGSPAVMLCHWPGMYCNGTKAGFRAFQRVVTALEGRFRDRMVWMKLSELARYAAARALTRIEFDRAASLLRMHAPFAAPRFTLRIRGTIAARPVLRAGTDVVPLRHVAQARDLDAGTWSKTDDGWIACFDLPRGDSTLAAGS
ncbi:MAG: hypothetical protein D6725_01320 [Planctomycetota bacterium]|nr:MAG: hypothetical protein D6725_01320 [Planctomycetota bacterium]